MSKATGGNRQKWKLDESALSRLIEGLGSADRYEELHRRLISFFRWERCQFPEECADEAIDRVAKRLQSGEVIVSLDAYVHGVCRFVLQETRRAAKEIPAVVDTAPAGDEQQFLCLDSCLNNLSAEHRAMILRYYRGESTSNGESRRKLAAELGLEINALRNRALRVRDKLENCVRNCMNSRPA